MFGKKKAPQASELEVPEEAVAPQVPDVSDESDVELHAEALTPKKKKSRTASILTALVGLVLLSAIAGGGGILLGIQTAATVERIIADREAREELPPNAPVPKYTSDTMVRALEPIITNLASPIDTWVRIETAVVFKAGALPNPDVALAEIRQDEIAYLRTISLSQLEGPSALQHLREDLNERASLRTGGKVSEVVIQTLVVQ
jgi:flagellar FliL protein